MATRASKAKVKSGRPSNAEIAARREVNRHRVEEPEQSQRSRKRKRAAETEGTQGNSQRRRADSPPSASDEPNSNDQHYQQLRAVTRRVPRHTIENKWGALPSGATIRVGQMMTDIERSVVMRLRDERKRTQASTAVQMVIRRLDRKLTRGLPFPPSTRVQREEDFDFEKILDSNRLLESQLTPILHSIELLKAETAKEEELLEVERERLALLEENAKSEASRRKQAAKKLHPILQVDNDEAKAEEFKEDIGLAEANPRISLSDISDDEDLTPIIDQLHNHLESMHGNASQLEGIGNAIIKSKALVQDILYTQFDANVYEHVILG